jgi:hypothetical protein
MLDALLYFGRFMLGEVGMAKDGPDAKMHEPAMQNDLGTDVNENETENIEL